jgi:parallel beta-helix repeat protein
VGPSASIDYNKAIMNRRYKVTLHEDPENHNDHLDADNDGNREQILKHNLSYFSGKGIWGGYDSHHHIIIRNNIVHDTPGSGIRFNDSDHVLIENNTVYNTTWWTSSASSAIVFAETIASADDNGTDAKMILRGNTVYNNWNRIPFFMTSLPENGQPPSGGYGNADYSTILDGQGLYVTRSDPNYNGTFLFENNLCVNNGKNGINFDRSNGSSALIRNNTIYFNGAHDLVQDISENVEGNPRHGGQKVAGIKANFVKNVTVINNIVETRFDNYSALELPNVTGTRTVSNNIFVLGSISWGASNPSNNQEDSPQFVNPTELSDDATEMSDWETYMDNVDFSLQSTSPAINAGNSEYSPQLDILGNARPILPENIQSSSSFETDLDGWVKWTNEASNNDIVLSQEQSKYGNQSIKVVGRTQNWHSAKFDLANLDVDQSYTIYLWVKNSEPNGTAQLTVRESVGSDISYNNITNPIEISDNEWTLLSADYTHTQNDSSFLYVKGTPFVDGIDGKSGADYFIDNFSLVSQGSPEVDFSAVGDIVDIGAYEYIESTLNINDLVDEISKVNNIIPFPNPVSDELHLIHLDLESKIQIFDIVGRKYDVEVIPNPELQGVKIDLSHLDPGSYVVQIFSEKGMTKNFKIIKQ